MISLFVCICLEGRVKAESLLYMVMVSGNIHLAIPPANLVSEITAEALVHLNDGSSNFTNSAEDRWMASSSSAGTSVATAAKASSEAPMTAGGMKMGLNAQVDALNMIDPP